MSASKRSAIGRHCLEERRMGLNRRGVIAGSLFICSLLLFALGIAALIVVPIIINNQVLKQTYIGFEKTSNGSSEYTETTKKWINPPYEMRMHIWVYNVTNAEEVLAGKAKPKVVQIGPYVFDEKQGKFDVKFELNNTYVLYRNNHRYFFNSSLSCPTCTLDKEVTVPNILYQKLIDVAAMKEIYKLTIQAVIAMVKESPFITAKVREVLFDGYGDPLITAICSKPILKALCGTVIPYKIGYFTGQNNTDDGVYEVNTGLENPYDIGKMKTWNNKTISKESAWDTKWASIVNGSDGQMFSPNLDHRERLTIFAGPICRSIQLAYYDEVTVADVPSWRYHVPADLYDYGIEANQMFCHKNSTPTYFDSQVQRPGCLPDGFLDVSKCLPSDPRVYFSSAHFYSTPREVWSSIEGLDEPNSENDQTFVELEPTTGVPVSARRVMQINVGMLNSTFTAVAKMPSLIMPVLWFNETAYFDAETRDQLVNQLVAIRNFTNKGAIACFSLATLFMLAVAAMYIYYHYHNSSYVIDDSNRLLVEEQQYPISSAEIAPAVPDSTAATLNVNPEI